MDVPPHWSTLRLKHAVRRIVGGSTPASDETAYWDGDVTWVTPSDISSRERITSSSRTITREGLASCSAELVPAGSLVITTRAPIGNVAVADVELCTNQGCKTLVHSGLLHEEFALRLFQALKQELQSLGAGTTFTELSTEALGSLLVPVPPAQEQAAIVRFLGHADRQIRRGIRAKQKLVALLTEQKQVTIHRAVTHGLDPNVRLKPSGVEWLGDLPEHWEMVPSRAMFRHRNERAGVDEEVLTASQAHGIVSRSDFMAREGRRVMQVITGRDILKHVEPDDFVISMRSFEGGLEWSQLRGAVSSAYVILVPTDNVYPPYFARLLKTGAYIGALRRTSDLVRDGQALRYANFLQVPLPRVPREEQRAIAAYLDAKVAGLDATIQRVRQELDLLREYRTSLIADVVTGRRDVREAAAGLPEEVDEPETFDGDVDEATPEDAEDLEPVEA